LQIEIAIIGFNRSLSTTWPLILKNVIEPLKSPQNNLILNGVISYTEEIIISERNNEHHFGETTIPESHKYRKLIEINQREVDNRVEDIYREFLKRRLFNPDIKGSEESKSLALLNLLRYLYLQSKYYDLIEEDTDFIIFMRPDLLPIDKLYYKKYLQQNNSISMPTWAKHGGHNDRFAIVPRYLAKDYFNRFHRLVEYSKNSDQLQAEQFLKWSLGSVAAQDSVIERMVRVRAGGLINLKEDFYLPHKYNKNQSWWKSILHEFVNQATNYKGRYVSKSLFKFDLLTLFRGKN